MITGPTDKLRAISVGDTISAEQHMILQAIVKKQVSYPNAFVTGVGTFIRNKISPSGAGLEWCVVWKPLTSDNSILNTVFVKTVEYNQSENKYTIVGEPVEVQCYPGHIRKDFFTLSTEEVGDVTVDTQICKLIRVSNVWHCEPFGRRARRNIDVLDRIRLSDCNIQVV